MRASGFGTAWNIAQAFGAGVAPFVATALWEAYEDEAEADPAVTKTTACAAHHPPTPPPLPPPTQPAAAPEHRRPATCDLRPYLAACDGSTKALTDLAPRRMLRRWWLHDTAPALWPTVVAVASVCGLVALRRESLSGRLKASHIRTSP